MGPCISRCVECATRLHDNYINWKWPDDYDNEVYLHQSTSSQRPMWASKPPSCIHVAIVDKNEDDVRYILEQNEEAKTHTNSSGETPLHQACRLGYCHIVNVLLDLGCPAGCVTNIGTPLHCLLEATKTGYTSSDRCLEFIKLLVLSGCNINDTDMCGKTPLFLATTMGNRAAVGMMLSLGADVNMKQNTSFSPLYMAAIQGDLSCVRLLLSQPGVDVNAVDTAGRSILLASLITITNDLRYERMPNSRQNVGYANGFVRLAVLESLLAAGADPNIGDNNRRTPLSIAFILLELDCINSTAPCRWSSYQQHYNYTPADSNTSTQDRESIYASIVRLLVFCGARVPPPNSTEDQRREPEWLHSLHKECDDARTQTPVISQRMTKLMHWCRVSIRGHLADIDRLQDVPLLPLPPSLVDYLLIKYI